MLSDYVVAKSVFSFQFVGIWSTIHMPGKSASYIQAQEKNPNTTHWLQKAVFGQIALTLQEA